MEVRAVEKFIRISPKKARLVADIVRGQNAKEALVTLKFTPKKAAKIIHKAVKSAISNAENNFNINGDTLVIKSISIDNGPSLKRFQPVSKGMAHHILKRTSHISVVVSDEASNKAKAGKAVKIEKKADKAVPKSTTKKEVTEMPEKIKSDSKAGTKEKK
jgi:large subunit ribosomal protein L22